MDSFLWSCHAAMMVFGCFNGFGLYTTARWKMCHILHQERKISAFLRIDWRGKRKDTVTARGPTYAPTIGISRKTPGLLEAVCLSSLFPKPKTPIKLPFSSQRLWSKPTEQKRRIYFSLDRSRQELNRNRRGETMSAGDRNRAVIWVWKMKDMQVTNLSHGL